MAWNCNLKLAAAAATASWSSPARVEESATLRRRLASEEGLGEGFRLAFNSVLKLTCALTRAKRGQPHHHHHHTKQILQVKKLLLQQLDALPMLVCKMLLPAGYFVGPKICQVTKHKKDGRKKTTSSAASVNLRPSLREFPFSKSHVSLLFQTGGILF